MKFQEGEKVIWNYTTEVDYINLLTAKFTGPTIETFRHRAVFIQADKDGKSALIGWKDISLTVSIDTLEKMPRK
jgi:hypothetical protein